jgi:hypothetical protein
MKKPALFGFFRTFLIFLTCSVALPAQGGECAKTCIEVRSEGGELVITAQRDPVRVVRKAPSASPTPQPTLTRRPTGTRSVQRRARPTFSDQIREVLPQSSFALLPAKGALIYEPLLVRAYGCEKIVKSLPILDTSVELDLAPRVEWSWGDGQVEWWGMGAIRGAHIYSRPGKVRIQMRCYWFGRYRTPHSPWAPIPEGIVATAAQSIELYRAQVFFTE